MYYNNCEEKENNKNNNCSIKNKYMKSDKYFNTSKESRINNHYVRNNHYINTTHHYVKDHYYVNDFYYNKDIYYYDREVSENSYDCGSETIVDPNSDCSKPLPHQCDCNYEECSKEDFYNSFKCKKQNDCNCNDY